MTTASNNFYKVQQVISAGEIEGLLTPLNEKYSVTLDDVPMATANGDELRAGAEVEMRFGTPDQTAVDGFENIADTVFPSGSPMTQVGDFVISDPISVGHGKAKIFLRFPNGVFRNTQNSGKLDNYDMAYRIEISSDQTDWVVVKDPSTKVTNTKAFDKVELINGYENLTWYVRVTKTAGANSNRHEATMVFNAVQTLFQPEPRLTYPNVAYASVTYNAKELGSTIPDLGLKVLGIKCQVPLSYNSPEYNPTTGVKTQNSEYSSPIWDGQMKVAYCDCPIWIAHEILTNTRFGAGSVINANNIDIFSFFEASYHSVGQIEDSAGLNGLSNRYTYNGRISEHKSLLEAVDEILMIAQAAIYEVDGVIRVYQDRPNEPSKIFCRSNVEDGEMIFNAVPLTQRITSIDITFNDREDTFKPTTRTVEYEDLISRYGHRSQQIAVNGVHNDYQALRHARLAILNSHLDGSEASMSVGWENFDIEIGDVAYVVDEVLTPDVIYGRVLDVADEVLTIDRPLVRDLLNETLVVQNGGLSEYLVSGIAGSNTITATEVIDADRHDVFLVTPDVDDLMQYRVIAYSTNDSRTLQLTKHDNQKFAIVEDDDEYTPTYPPSDFELNPCTGLSGVGVVADGVGTVYLNWIVPADKDAPQLPDERVSSYLVSVDAPMGTFEDVVSENQFVIQSASLGSYQFTVTPQTQDGLIGPPASSLYEFEFDGVSTLIPPVVSSDFYTEDVFITITETFSDGEYVNAGERFAPVAYQLSFGSPVQSVVEIPFVDYDHSHKYVYTIGDNTSDNDGNPTREVDISVRIRDNNGNLSSPTVVQATNDAPLAPRQTLTQGLTNFTVSLLPDASLDDWEIDVAGFLVEIDDEPIDVGMQSVITFNAFAGQTYTVRSAAYDIFGKSELSWSPADQITTIEFPDVPDLPDFSRVEYRFTGLEWTINPENGTIGWNDHSVTQYTWDEDSSEYVTVTKDIESGSLTYVEGLTYIGLDFDESDYVRTTFDDWYNDADYLMGEIRQEDGAFSWFDEGVNTLAVNAISAKHIQADAILGNNIKANEKIVIGDSKTAPNTIVLDGTATGDSDPMLWLGELDSDGDGSTASFSVAKDGSVMSRKNLYVEGDATIGGLTQLTDSTIIGSYDPDDNNDHLLQSATWSAGGEAGWQLTSDGEFNLRNNGGNIGLQMSPDRIDVYDDSGALKVRIGRLV
ncbi:hypothetical protein FCV55_07090 [Vibrio sp. F13]|uniref:phage tail protein n=1 Tax=Vibrio sp. F13 TaxID=2070777 RepID=UPI0010BD47A6|nr:phage tail protein [Vibrio sp. F13]TKF71726.1 hypothetical protein FCV55_07090 [Vibrio sp. F13]